MQRVFDENVNFHFIENASLLCLIGSYTTFLGDSIVYSYLNLIRVHRQCIFIQIYFNFVIIT